MKTTDYHAVVSIGTLKPKGPGSNPFLDGVCVKFASSSCSFIDSLPQSKDLQVRLTEDSKLVADVTVSLNCCPSLCVGPEHKLSNPTSLNTTTLG